MLKNFFFLLPDGRGRRAHVEVSDTDTLSDVRQKIEDVVDEDRLPAEWEFLVGSGNTCSVIFPKQECTKNAVEVLENWGEVALVEKQNQSTKRKTKSSESSNSSNKCAKTCNVVSPSIKAEGGNQKDTVAIGGTALNPSEQEKLSSELAHDVERIETKLEDGDDGPGAYEEETVPGTMDTAFTSAAEDLDYIYNSFISDCPKVLAENQGNLADRQAKDTSHECLRQLTKILHEKPDFCSETRRNELLQTIQDLSKMSTPPTIFCVLGATGVGKSSLLNGLLDEADILPTSGCHGCTAAVVELKFNSELLKKSNDGISSVPLYLAEVEFMKPEEWSKELKCLVEECSLEHERFFPKDENEAYQILVQVYRKNTLNRYDGMKSAKVIQGLLRKTNMTHLCLASMAEKQTITLEDWKTTLKNYVERCSTQEKLLEFHEDAEEAQQKLEQVFGRDILKQYQLQPTETVFQKLGVDARVRKLLTAKEPGKDRNSILVKHGSVIAGSDRVSELLGHRPMKLATKRDKRVWSEDFSKSINKYIYTQGNGDQPQTWPLVVKVQLKGPWSVLSTGAVLVDLPGVRDNNAARANVAVEYIPNCNQVLIVAPSRRAVDDKTARDLQGEQFKRMLLMDGQYGNISFVCTQTDDIKIKETMRDLEDLAKAVDGRWEKMLELDNARTDLKVQVNDKKQKLKELEDQPKEHKLAKTDSCKSAEQTEAEINIFRKTFIREIERLQAKINTIEMELKQLCASVRNEYIKSRLQEDFQQGLNELCGSRDKLLEAFNMKVFTISASDYLRLMNIENESPCTFLEPSQTEMPLLKSFVQESTARVSGSFVKLFVERVSNLLEQVMLLTTDRRNTPKSLLDVALKDLDANVNHIAQQFQGIMDEEIKTNLEPALQAGAQEGSSTALITVESWGSKNIRSKEECKPGENGLLWPTYRATSIRDGVYSSVRSGEINLIQELCHLMEKEFSDEWYAVVESSLHLMLDKAENEIVLLYNSTIQSFAQNLNEKSTDGSETTAMQTVASTSAVNNVTSLFKQVRSNAVKSQRKLRRELWPFIQDKMKMAFKSVVDVPIKGDNFERMKSAMRSNSQAALDGVYVEAEKMLTQGIKSLVKEISLKIASTAVIVKECLEGTFSITCEGVEAGTSYGTKVQERVRACMLPQLKKLVQAQRGACELLGIIREDINLSNSDAMELTLQQEESGRLDSTSDTSDEHIPTTMQAALMPMNVSTTGRVLGAITKASADAPPPDSVAAENVTVDTQVSGGSMVCNLANALDSSSAKVSMVVKPKMLAQEDVRTEVLLDTAESYISRGKTSVDVPTDVLAAQAVDEPTIMQAPAELASHSQQDVQISNAQEKRSTAHVPTVPAGPEDRSNIPGSDGSVDVEDGDVDPETIETSPNNKKDGGNKDGSGESKEKEISFSLLISPGPLGLAVKFGTRRGVIIDAINTRCKLKKYLKVGDRIISINGKEVRTKEDIFAKGDDVGKARKWQFSRKISNDDSPDANSQDNDSHSNKDGADVNPKRTATRKNGVEDNDSNEGEMIVKECCSSGDCSGAVSPADANETDNHGPDNGNVSIDNSSDVHRENIMKGNDSKNCNILYFANEDDEEEVSFSLPISPGQLDLSLQFPRAIVTAINPSCAFKNVLAVGDRLISIDGKEIKTKEDLVARGDDIDKTRMWRFSKRIETAEENTKPRAVRVSLDSHRQWRRDQQLNVLDTFNRWLEATILDIALPSDVLRSYHTTSNTSNNNNNDSVATTTAHPRRRTRRSTPEAIVSANDFEGRLRLLLVQIPDGEFQNSNIANEPEGTYHLLDERYRPRSDNSNVQLLLIHYNGWSNEWDEWIRSDSERLRPSRTWTRNRSGVAVGSSIGGIGGGGAISGSAVEERELVQTKHSCDTRSCDKRGETKMDGYQEEKIDDGVAYATRKFDGGSRISKKKDEKVAVKADKSTAMETDSDGEEKTSSVVNEVKNVTEAPNDGLGMAAADEKKVALAEAKEMVKNVLRNNGSDSIDSQDDAPGANGPGENGKDDILHITSPKLGVNLQMTKRGAIITTVHSRGMASSTDTKAKPEGTTAASVVESRNGTSAPAAIAASPPVSSATFPILSLGVNGAVSEKVLNGKVFILGGLFNEVHGHKAVAYDEIAKMIVSFGGKVLSRRSTNTTHLLAGKDIEPKKITEAAKKSIVIINLRRLQKLLLGRTTFEELNGLDRLTKDAFKGNAYEAAGPLPPLPLLALAPLAPQSSSLPVHPSQLPSQPVSQPPLQHPVLPLEQQQK